jgi:hypothetical protein
MSYINPYTYIYHDTHLILYIMTHVLWCKIYDISYAKKCIYIYHTIISYVIYYMTHVLVLLPYTHSDDTFDIFKLFIYEVDCDTCNSYKWINSELLFKLYIIWHMFYAIYHMTHVLCFISTLNTFIRITSH